MGHLWLVRHPRVLNMDGLCYGALDVPSDPEHAHEVAQTLARQLPRQTPLWTSPLRRCAELANQMSRLRPDLQPIVQTDLREFDFGIWEGQAWQAITPEQFAPWEANFLDHAPGGADTVAKLISRVSNLLRQASELPRCVWITHAGVIRAVHHLLRKDADSQIAPAPLTMSTWPAIGIDYGASLIVELPSEG